MSRSSSARRARASSQGGRGGVPSDPYRPDTVLDGWAPANSVCRGGRSAATAPVLRRAAARRFRDRTRARPPDHRRGRRRRSEAKQSHIGATTAVRYASQWLDKSLGSRLRPRTGRRWSRAPHGRWSSRHGPSIPRVPTRRGREDARDHSRMRHGGSEDEGNLVAQSSASAILAHGAERQPATPGWAAAKRRPTAGYPPRRSPACRGSRGGDGPPVSSAEAR